MAGKSFWAQSSARLLQLLNSQLAEFDDTIAAAVAEHPDARIFASFPGPFVRRSRCCGRCLSPGSSSGA